MYDNIVAVPPASCHERPSTPANLPGRANVRIARAGSRSVVTHARATSPLRLLTPSNHGPAAWVYTSTYGGGLVDGDGLSIDLEVASSAAAFVTTQASTKVYRSPHGTSAEVRARVGPAGLLVVAPDPVVCFAGARYRQVQRFQIADDAGLVVLDWLVAGRCAAGERWAFLDYYSRLEVTVGDRLIVYDPVALRTTDGDLPGRLGRFDVLAVAIVAGAAFRSEAAAVLDLSSEQRVTRRAGQLLVASPLGAEGCIVRLAGTCVEQAGRTLRALLGFVPACLRDDPWKRKW